MTLRLVEPPRPPSLSSAVLVAAAWVAVLWWITTLDQLLGWDLGRLGVQPGTALGLLGILSAPLIHSSFEHLIANTGSALLLGTLLWYGYPRSRLWVFVLIWVGSGLGVWFTGRPSSHIGASGLTHGLMFFLFVSGLLRRDPRSVVFAMIAFFMYGGMVWGVFPQEEARISYESHFWGAVWGLTTALMFRRYDPKPVPKRYSWELDPEAEDPVIGDQWRDPNLPRDPNAPPVDLEMYDELDGYNDLDFPPDGGPDGGPDDAPPDDFVPKRRRWRARRPR